MWARKPAIRLGTLVLACFLTSTLWAQGTETLRQRFDAGQAGYPLTTTDGEPLVAAQALADFYGQRGYQLAWAVDGRPGPLVSQWLKLVAASTNDGLSPDDYHYAAVQKWLSYAAAHGQAGNIVDLDLLLSDGYLRLADHLGHGKLSPDTLQPRQAPDNVDKSLSVLLAQALETRHLDATLQALAPAAPGYAALKAARQRFVALSATPWPPIPAGPALHSGAVDARVPAVRRRLIALGDLSASNGDDAALYDAELVSAVAAFQQRHGLLPDGILGRATLKALNVQPRERVQQIDVNLERWRWLPREAESEHVMVNIAGFDLKLIDAGKILLQKRVVVGRDYRRTPVMSGQIRYLVINPTWTVPRKLAVEDKLPEIQRDPDYLRKMGFTVYAVNGGVHQVVDPSAIDWAHVPTDPFPYRLVQRPGPFNALGQIKFVFPNADDVYLHDTPSRELFRQSRRSFSSGCIRLEDPLELAHLLLRDASDEARQHLASLLQSGETGTVMLPKPVPIHIEYWTAWVDEVGNLQFRDDLYHRDPAVLRGLLNVPSGAGSAKGDR